MMRPSSIVASIALLMLPVRANMNTNSLGVYCPPPITNAIIKLASTNAIVTNPLTPTNIEVVVGFGSEAEMKFDQNQRVIDIKQQARLGGLYDMMCERTDVPSADYAYATSKHDVAYVHLPTNRAQITASRALKHTPMVDLCANVASFLDDGSTTNAGPLTIHPMTFALNFDAHASEWMDVGPHTRDDVWTAYERMAEDSVLSPGRGNYRYFLAFAGGTNTYNNANSILPVWLHALDQITTFDPSRLSFNYNSADYVSTLVQESPFQALGGPKILYGWKWAETAAILMTNGVPRVPKALIPAQAAELVAPLRYSWYSLSNPVVVTNESASRNITYELLAEDILRFLRGQNPLPTFDGEKVDIYDDAFLAPASIPKPPYERVLSEAADITKFSEGMSLNVFNGVQIEYSYTYNVSYPPYLTPEFVDSLGWTYMGTIYDQPSGSMADVYVVSVPGRAELMSSNITCAGKVEARVVENKVLPHDWHLVGGEVEWPTMDAFVRGYANPDDCCAYIFGHCEYDDDHVAASGDQTAEKIYDMYGASRLGAPSNSVPYLLNAYFNKNMSFLPRTMEWNGKLGYIYVYITDSVPNLDLHALPAMVFCEVGTTPAQGIMRWEWLGPAPESGMQTVVSSPLISVVSSGKTVQVLLKKPTVFGHVKWDFLNLRPETGDSNGN